MSQKAIRLDRFLAEAGAGTRSEVKKMIQKGQVLVNGIPAKKPETKVSVPPDQVELNGVLLTAAPEYVYYLLHKPAGVVSATEDTRDKTVLDLLPPDRRNLFPVGRLDKDTEGLLLITDDGPLAHELLSPNRHVDKTYYIVAEGNLGKEALQALEAGVDIGEDRLTRPAQARVLTISEDKSLALESAEQCYESEESLRLPEYERSEICERSEQVHESEWKLGHKVYERPEKFRESGEQLTDLLLTIHEGKFHQVKRMLEAVGSRVLYLRRVSMGPLKLPEDLACGDYRPLTEQEIQALKNIRK